MKSSSLLFAAFLLLSTISLAHAAGGTASFLSGKVTLVYNDAGNGMAQYVLTGATNGYVAFGFGSTMVGTKPYVGYISNGAAVVQMYDLTSTRDSGVNALSLSTYPIYNMTGAYANSQSVFTFVAPIDSSRLTGSQSVVVAMGTCSGAVICDHGNNEDKGSINFATGVNGASSNAVSILFVALFSMIVALFL